MANVEKKDGGERAQTQAVAPQSSSSNNNNNQQQQEIVRRDPFQMFARDPFAMMREMMSNPFRFMSSFGGGGGRDLATWNPSFEIRETNDAFVFKADMPGIKPDELDISLTGNELTVSGKREQKHDEESEGRYHTYERSYGSFTRVFSLPESADLDNIRSDLKDGELTLVIPKQPNATPTRRKIDVGSGEKH